MLAALPRTALRFVLALVLSFVALSTIPIGAPSAAGATAPSEPCIGQSPPEALQITSAERASVYRLYCAGFLRLPDAEGLDYWTGGLLAHRLDIAAMAQQFITSKEFELRYGTVDDVGFLELVYRNVLGRGADEEGHRYWATVLAEPGFGRDDLLIAFSESAEFAAATGTATGSTGTVGTLRFTGGIPARQAADVELARGTYEPTQCYPDTFGGNVRWVRGAWNLTWCVRPHPGWAPAVTDAVYVHEAIHVRISLLYTYRDALTAEQRAEVERVVDDKSANEGLTDLWTMRLVPGYEGAPKYAADLFTNAIWEELFALYPLGGALPDDVAPRA